jgi:hypothetical protein
MYPVCRNHRLFITVHSRSSGSFFFGVFPPMDAGAWGRAALLLLLVLGAVAAAAAGAASSAGKPALGKKAMKPAAGAAVRTEKTINGETVLQSTVEVNVTALMSQTVLELAPFPGKQWTARLISKRSKEEDSDRPDVETWYGSIDEDPLGHLEMVSKGGILAGTLACNGSYTKIFSRPDGTVTVEQHFYNESGRGHFIREPDSVLQDEVDAGANLDLTTDLQTGLPLSLFADAAERRKEQRQSRRRRTLADNGLMLDMLMVYSSGTCCMHAFGYRDCDPEQCIPYMEALIMLMETEVNIGFINSNISTRLRIAKTYLAAGHNDSAGTFLQNYRWLRNGADGVLDEVHTLRNTYMADVVSIVTSTSDGCGVAGQPGAFTAVNLGCATGMYALGK